MGEVDERKLTVDMVLYNAKVYTQGRIKDAGIAIEDDKIVRVAKEANLPSASNRIDLKKRLALPGLIDVHVHLRDQQQAYKETFSTGTAAAVAGGITTVLDMPNNKPVTMDSASLKERIRMAERNIFANVGFYSAFPENLDEIERVVKEGAFAFKLYLTALLSAFNKAGKLGVPVAIHAEDKNMIEEISDAERKIGHNDSKAYLRAHSPEVEAKAIKRILKIAYKTNMQLHFCHISSKEAITQISNARKKGLKASCEVTPHHLFLTSDDLKEQGTLMLTDPPVRNRNTVEELWNALKNNHIDIVASDHAPHLTTEKKADSVWNVKPGIPGLETLLPLLLEKVNAGRLSIHNIVRLMAEKPTEIFHLHGFGLLEEGFKANITVVDLHQRDKIDASKFYSKAKYSPFDGWQTRGMPVKTFVNGRLVMDEGEVIMEAKAAVILRGQAS